MVASCIALDGQAKEGRCGCTDGAPTLTLVVEELGPICLNASEDTKE